MNFTPDEYDEWQAERIAARLAVVRSRRPAQLSHPGVLHHDLIGWSDRLRAGRGGNLALTGPIGVGKSWSVWELLDRSVQAGWLGSWDVATAADWQAAISPPTHREALTKWREVDLLALDDLGAVRVNEWALELLGGVVDARWSNARPTVITTNVEELGEALGPRIASRLGDGLTIVSLGGEDRRAR